MTIYSIKGTLPAGAIAAWAAPASAQDPAVSRAASEAETGAAEIVVSARRKVESLQGGSVDRQRG
jgi:hypothetical protein